LCLRTDRTLLMIGCVCRWQNLVTRAEERHKLVTASLNFYKTAEQVSSNHRLVFSYLWTCDLYGPYVMFMMHADPLRGQVGGGLGPGNSDFLGLEMATSKASVIRAQKAQCSKFFLSHCPPPPPTTTPLPHLYTALDST
jgi:hypothetical protein